MRILVIDDNPIHQKSAMQILSSSHDIVIINNHDDAIKALRLGSTYQRGDVENLLIRRGLPKNMEAALEIIDSSTQEWQDWCNSEMLAKREVYWDVVLCDLLMPVGRESQGQKGQQYVGQEMPVGWSLAIAAALRGSQYVAIATDLNHHNHPASAMLDATNRTIFDLNGAKALFTNYFKKIDINGNTCKDWGWLLKWLLEGEQPPWT